MTDSMVERVRLTICLDDDPAQIGTARSCEGGCLHVPHSGVCPYDSAARAAIQAMREPTEAMRKFLGGTHNARQQYREAIDAALEQPE